MKRFFKDLENGFATRVCFAQLPDTSFTEIPVFAPYTESERAEIIRWARELDAIGKSSSISSEIIVPLAGKELNSDTKGLVHISCPQDFRQLRQLNCAKLKQISSIWLSLNIKNAPN
jgi:hypothetical protein